MSKTPVNYSVREPLFAVREGAPKPYGFLTIPPGSIIALRGEVQPSGFVDVLYNGRIVAVFMRDITARADVVESRATGST